MLALGAFALKHHHAALDALLAFSLAVIALSLPLPFAVVLVLTINPALAMHVTGAVVLVVVAALLFCELAPLGPPVRAEAVENRLLVLPRPVPLDKARVEQDLSFPVILTPTAEEKEAGQQGVRGWAKA